MCVGMKAGPCPLSSSHGWKFVSRYGCYKLYLYMYTTHHVLAGPYQFIVWILPIYGLAQITMYTGIAYMYFRDRRDSGEAHLHFILA